MAVKPKKKRFEGLIHFRSTLRQTMVCLQASLRNKFATSVQSEYVKSLDEGPDDAHYLLFSSTQKVGEVQSESEIDSHHILSRFYQKESQDLKNEVVWHHQDNAKISLWIDACDALASSELFRIISHICHSGQTLNLKACQNWGSQISLHSYQDLKTAKEWLKQWQSLFRLSQDRLDLICLALDQTVGEFQRLDQLVLASDGTCTSLIIEGQVLDQHKKDLNSALRTLRNLPLHSITLNLGEVDQISLTSPIRSLTNQSLPSLCSFLLIRGLKKTSSQGLSAKIAS